MVASPAVLVFDGDCGFCRFWIARWQHRSGDRIEYLPFQHPAIARRFPDITTDRFARAVHLIEPDGRVSEGALAVFRLLALTRPGSNASSAGSMLTTTYAHVPGAAVISEGIYRLVANHRPFFGWLTTRLWGRVTEPSTYALSGWLFRRLLGVIYFLAFWSLARQIAGLVGDHGILPARFYMDAARAWTDAEHLGVDRFRVLPTLFWISTSDAWLKGMCIGGAALSVLLIAGVAPLIVLPLLWVAYLSLSVVGQDFLSFQWDALLLEVGFLAIFIAPWGIRERLRQAADPPRLGVGLLLWLLFRLMVGSGAVKLASGDPTWRSLTALTFHYETQPIPTPVAWYAHHLPIWFNKASTAAVLGIELFVPLLMIAPRRLRAEACMVLVVFQALIALTGNYAFFNLLAVSLCVFLIDDAALLRRLQWMANIGGVRTVSPHRYAVLTTRARRRVLMVVAAVTLPVSALTFAGSFGIDLPGSSLISPLAAMVGPFRSVNGYGLFAIMTTTRPEIVIEGSNDGVLWSEYEFRYKAGDLHRRPPWVAPHQPRLDWQMWFAALSSYDNEPWFRNFCVRLLEASPDVLRLLERDPFQGRPPKYIRAVQYQYRFSNTTQRRVEGLWWTRDREGNYSSTLSLEGRR